MPKPKGRVYGKITDKRDKGLSGIKVEVWDEDWPDADDRIGVTYTNSRGEYSLPYPRGGWDTRVGGVSFRPDVYIVASMKNSAGRWVEKRKSRVYNNVKLRLGKKIDLKIDIADVQTKRTTFKVKKDGFKFGNSFVLNDVFGFEGRFEMGFCGGMSAGALHRFKTRCVIPSTTTIPTEGASLFKELFQRQLDSIPPGMITTIYDWQRSPDLPHTHTPHSIRYRQKAEWSKLKALLDKGEPTVLVLIRSEGYLADISKNHQVLALGYEFDPNTRDLTVEVYDPNDPEGSGYLYLCLGGGRLRARQKYSNGGVQNFRGFLVNWAGDNAAKSHHNECTAGATRPTRRPTRTRVPATPGRQPNRRRVPA
jgi:hypothetical protein